MSKIRVTVWNEYRHERSEAKIAEIYPEGIHGEIKNILSECDDVEVTLATLDMPEHGLTNEVLDNTDVLIWWGHMAHKEVLDEVAIKVCNRVYAGMGFIALHSAHHSKPFKLIVGTTGNLSWGRDQRAIVWNVNPTHPIAEGIPAHFELFEEMYGEPFGIPEPEKLLFIGAYESGEVFRSGCLYQRGNGKIFYFQPGHESCRSYHNPYVQRIITNAVRWAKPNDLGYPVEHTCPRMLTKTVDEFNA